MASTLKLVAGNTAPAWQITCERDSVPINLTGCTVSVIIANGPTVTQTAGTCAVINTTNGIVQYQPVATDCPTAGTYKVDVRIVYSDSTVEIVYEQLKVKARKPIITS